METVELKVKRVHEKAVIPSYAHDKGDAGMDIVAVGMKENFGRYLEYETGLEFEFPEGYCMHIYPRSSISDKDLIMANPPGLNDPNFRGELKIRFRKIGERIYHAGDKIAQLAIVPCPKIKCIEVSELSKTERGEGSYGSTGK